MSLQFGKCNLDGKPVNPEDLDQVRAMLAPYGPDGEGYICKDNFGILYRAFHTTKESHRETQPYVSISGSIITWDGRLDNREDLIERLAGGLSPESTDPEIVAAARECWGRNAFRELIGDWALSVWNPVDRSLILAKDFLGARHLYYSVEKDQVTWCTILDPLVFIAGRSFGLEEEYIAGWLSLFPAAHLTPYVGIHGVPPSSFVRITSGTQRIEKYWDFDPAKRIRYRTDSEYEQHFRSVFSESVRRRLRSDSPILAELSGGMDSSSIVCIADQIIDRGLAQGARLDTVSYYDDTEANWNERPYFSKIEEKRGRTGCHIDVSSQGIPAVEQEIDHFAATPTSMRSVTDASKQFALCMTSHGNRVLVSGLGGDEVTGGVPTPIPELADLIAHARFGLLVHELKTWSLNKRKPWLHLLIEAASTFLPPAFGRSARYLQPAPWLASDFVRRNKSALNGYPTGLRLFSGPPSFHENLSTLDLLRRQLACFALTREPLHQTAYPYLDREFLAFLYAIPREQIVRPNQRRSLMRRALAGIVPEEILNRRRKAFVTRPPLKAVSTLWETRSHATKQMHGALLGIISPRTFNEALERVSSGQDSSTAVLIRALRLELWLRHLARHQILRNCASFGSRGPSLDSRGYEKAFGQ
jgi:asparagine synthase (glutamine-hydrolysing)